MAKRDTKEIILYFLMVVIGSLFIMKIIGDNTSLNLADVTATLAMFVLALAVGVFSFMLLFRSDKIEKKDWATIFFTILGIVALGFLFQKSGLLPDLFSAGLNGLQSILGI